MELIIGTTSELIKKVQSIRRQVFVVEQRIPQELDLDGLDDDSYHVLVSDGNSLVAAARLHPVDQKHAVMARISVLKKYRGSGVATKIVTALLLHAQEMGFSSIEIHAHEYLRNFYEKFGFEFIQNVEIVGEHQLIEMRYQVAST